MMHSVLYDRITCLEYIKFITENTNVNIKTSYNQYLIRNYLQKISKCKVVKLWFVGSMIYENEGGGAHGPWGKFWNCLLKLVFNDSEYL